MLTIFEELVSVAICSRSKLRSTGLHWNKDKPGAGQKTPGPGCSKPDYANRGLARILISVL